MFHRPSVRHPGFSDYFDDFDGIHVTFVVFLTIVYIMSEIQMIPLTLIDPPVWQLRDFKERATVSLEMLEQIKEDGNVSQSILVRPTSDGRYEVVDGLTRYTQLKMAGASEAPCMVQDLTDEQALIKQVQLNSTRRETTSIQYLRAFLHLMELQPGITVETLANKFTKKVKWVKDILRLSNLSPKAKLLVERGEINATNAHILARINQRDQEDYIEAACTMPVREFQTKIVEVVNRHREDVGTLNLRRYHGGEKLPHMRPMQQVKDEIESWAEGRMAVIEQDLKTPLDGFKAGVLWVMSLDPHSLKLHREKRIEREARRTRDIKRLRRKKSSI